MQKSYWWISTALILLAAGSFLDGQMRTRSPGLVDRDYVFALAAANRFLSAWQERDQAKGLSLVSPRLRDRMSESELRHYISGLSNPFNAAFEVGRGVALPDGRMAFEVRLHTFQRGALIEPRRFQPPPSRIVLGRIGEEDWLVDELP